VLSVMYITLNGVCDAHGQLTMAADREEGTCIRESV
jgi:hypothetical protein